MGESLDYCENNGEEGFDYEMAIEDDLQQELERKEKLKKFKRVSYKKL